MPPPPRALPEEVVEEILLRLPPHKPAYLVRASVASKPWLALVSGARFRDRYRQFHGPPPMLGFLKSRPWNCWFRPEDPSPPFISTSRFRARISDDDSWDHNNYAVWDCRHGRVLLGEKNAAPMKMAVWDPMTGRRRELQEPRRMVVEHKDGLHAAAVVCAVSGCDHRACNDGPFRVVFFSLHNVDEFPGFAAQACVSSPETTEHINLPSDSRRAQWSEPCSRIPIEPVGFIEPNHPVLVKDALHFMLAFEYDYNNVLYDGLARVQILKYDLGSDSLSLIYPPMAAEDTFGNSILMAMEDGTLGFARWQKLTLTIWSRQTGSDGVALWTRSRVISLKNIPPVKVRNKMFVLLGSMEGHDIIFVYTELGVYQINLKTLRRKKIWKEEYFNALIPYTGFYIPRGIYLYLLFCVIWDKFLSTKNIS
jgi:hypothetical protein